MSCFERRNTKKKAEWGADPITFAVKAAWDGCCCRSKRTFSCPQTARLCVCGNTGRGSCSASSGLADCVSQTWLYDSSTPVCGQTGSKALFLLVSFYSSSLYLTPGTCSLSQTGRAGRTVFRRSDSAPASHAGVWDFNWLKTTKTIPWHWRSVRVSLSSNVLSPASTDWFIGVAPGSRPLLQFMLSPTAVMLLAHSSHLSHLGETAFRQKSSGPSETSCFPPLWISGSVVCWDSNTVPVSRAPSWFWANGEVGVCPSVGGSTPCRDSAPPLCCHPFRNPLC